MLQNGEYSVTNFAVTVESDDHYVTFSLDNSPRKFATSTKSPNRYLDGVDLIDRNKLGIADQALKRAKKEYPALMCQDEQKCLNDMGYIIDAATMTLHGVVMQQLKKQLNTIIQVVY